MLTRHTFIKALGAVVLPLALFLSVSPVAQAVTLNITYDSSVSSAPAGFKNAINYVAQTFDSYFTNPVDVNINVGWGEVAGQTLSANAVGESITNYYSGSTIYNTIAQDLYNTDSAASNSSTAHSAAQYIPATSPIKTSMYISAANAKAIGAVANSTTTSDGSVGFDSSYAYSFNTTGPTASGTYDFVGLAMHEISEVMGRTGFLPGSTSGTYYQTPLDLFRYTSPGVLDTNSPGTANYFSVNGGSTSLNTFNTISGADYADWAGATPDAFNAFIGSPGTTEPFSVADLSVLNAIGWQTSNATYSTVASIASASSAVPGPLTTELLALAALACLFGFRKKERDSALFA